jgi:hypothetical protein
MVDHGDAAADGRRAIEGLNGTFPTADGAGAIGRAPSRLSGKDPTLVPTPLLTSEGFEDFTERLLSAHRFCVEPPRRVSRVERRGRRGDKQDGIDFEGEFSDGMTAAWQCQCYDKLRVGDVRDAVRACTFVADEYYLVGKPRVAQYEPDTDLRDSEQVPLNEPAGICADGAEAFFSREVLLYSPDAWIDGSKTKIGYEISFTRHFYKPAPMRTLAEIQADIRALGAETDNLIAEIAGGWQ